MSLSQPESEETIMFYSDATLTQKATILKTALDKTEALIIGVGAGLSAAAGLDYDNLDTFNTLFPGYQNRYGLNSINEADFYQFPTSAIRTLPYQPQTSTGALIAVAP
jgi:hypothetical protein